MRRSQSTGAPLESLAVWLSTDPRRLPEPLGPDALRRVLLPPLLSTDTVDPRRLCIASAAHYQWRLSEQPLSSRSSRFPFNARLCALIDGHWRTEAPGRWAQSIRRWLFTLWRQFAAVNP